MSRFTSRTRDLINTLYDGNAARFAGACGVDQGTLSRLLRGKFSPASTTLETMAANLPTEQAGVLCAAWLEDLVPPQLICAISISLSHEVAAQVPRHAAKSAWADCDHETRTALEELAALSVRSPEARDALISAAAFVRGDSVLSPTAAAAVSIARSAKSRQAKPSTPR